MKSYWMLLLSVCTRCDICVMPSILTKCDRGEQGVGGRVVYNTHGMFSNDL